MTVRNNILKLTQVVDAFAKSGVEFTASNICTIPGSRFTSQRLVDIYNHARVALLSAAREMYAGSSEWKNNVGGALVSTTLKWDKSGSESSASKPTGLMFLVSMSTAAGVPMILLEPHLESVIRSGRSTHYIQSADRIYIFDIGTQYKHFGDYVPTASTYRISYWGLTDWIIADVTGGTAIETINDNHYPKLIEIAAAIARGAGAAEATSLAKALLGAKN